MKKRRRSGANLGEFTGNIVVSCKTYSYVRKTELITSREIEEIDRERSDRIRDSGMEGTDRIIGRGVL